MLHSWPICIIAKNLFSWNPTQMLASRKPSGDPMETPPICFYMVLLKLYSTSQAAMRSSSIIAIYSWATRWIALIGRTAIWENGVRWHKFLSFVLLIVYWEGWDIHISEQRRRRRPRDTLRTPWSTLWLISAKSTARDRCLVSQTLRTWDCNSHSDVPGSLELCSSPLGRWKLQIGVFGRWMYFRQVGLSLS